MKVNQQANLGTNGVLRRVEYTKSELTEKNIHPDPLVQFKRWLENASSAGISEPNAMTLATSTEYGIPSARIVLLKEVTDRGFVFYTNYGSRKGRELQKNPSAAAVFFWQELERQVRISGHCHKLSRTESENFFYLRPRGSQISAWVSNQSAEIKDRIILEKKFSTMSDDFKDLPIPPPPFWGGYILVPQSVEFWQGRQDRLHDRIIFSRNSDESWIIKRLSP